MSTFTLSQNRNISPAALSDREELASQVYSITATLTGIATVTFLLTFIFESSWQFLALTADFLLVTLLCLFLQHGLLPIHKHTNRVILYNLVLHTGLTAFSLLVEGISPIIGSLILVHTILIVSSLLTEKINLGIILGLIFSTGSALLSSSSPVTKLTIAAPPPGYMVIMAILGLLLILVLGILTLRFITSTLGMKLIAVSLLIALLPLVVISAIQSGFTSGALRDQTNQALDLAANETATRVDDFIASNRTLIQKEAQLPVFISYMNLPPSMRSKSREEQELRLTLESLVAQSDRYLSSYGVINIAGKNIYDSNPLEIGNDEKNTDYFLQTVNTRQVYVSPILFSNNNDPFIYIAAPIRNNQQQIIGILRARYDALVLQNLLEGNANLIGSRSYPILLDENYFRIADTLTPNLIYQSITPLSPPDVRALVNLKRLPETSDVVHGTNLPEFQEAINTINTEKFFSAQVIPGDERHLMFGTAIPLANKPWTVVFLKESSALESLLTNQNNTSLRLAILFAAVVALLSTVFGTTLSRPIIQLKSTADRISTGDLSAAALIQTHDEIGALGNAFNLMTQRLRESIYELEDRVNERTAELATQNQALQLRSQQLLTVSDVAREIASTQELATLLDEVTRLISERFNFYHVGIFLIDDKREYALLQAANSEGGKRMLARQHKLKVGQVGMVGYVTSTGSPRISTDVGKDAVFFNNPDLPLTRSEMTLPLMVGNKIIGALDVQSVKSDAFTDDDVKLFSTLADQVAIAIQNNELFTQTTLALQEAQSLHRQYLRQEWQRETSRRAHTGYIYSSKGLVPYSGGLSDEVERALSSGDLITSQVSQEKEGDSSVMVMPIKLRGEPIGVIHLQQTELSDRNWSENEIATVQSVADQVSQALENARLFEQTVRRAERERKALDITNKIRSTNDPQAMLEIAVKELQQALQTSRAQIFIQSNTPAEQLSDGKSIPGGQPPEDNGRQ